MEVEAVISSSGGDELMQDLIAVEASNGSANVNGDDHSNNDEEVSEVKVENTNGDEVDANPTDEAGVVSQNNAQPEGPVLPLIVDDLAELGIEWLLTKSEEGSNNWGKEYNTTETLENIEKPSSDVEIPKQPEVKSSTHHQIMHLVPLKDNGMTSTTLTWIRKSAVHKDSASDRRITIRGLNLGDLMHARVYTLIQLAQTMEYSSTERSMSNTCSSGILTLNFRTILDRLIALRRYLLDIEMPGRRLEIVCTFPDHKRPPEFETLWKAYETEGVPPCASQRPEKEILARQLVVKNFPIQYTEDNIKRMFNNTCETVELTKDYQDSNCAIVTFADVVTCHIAHSRQTNLNVEKGIRPVVFLRTEMLPNSKLTHRRAKEETEEERYMRHTFELLWNHQQKVVNSLHVMERFNRMTGGEFQTRTALTTIIKKLPAGVKQRVEDRVQKRVTKEAEEKAAAAANDDTKPASDVPKTEDGSAAKAEPDDDGAVANQAHKRTAADTPTGSQLAKRAKRKSFRGAGNSAFGGQRRAVQPVRRDQQLQQQQPRMRGTPLTRRSGPPSPRGMPMSNLGSAGARYVPEARASPWLVPPAAAGSSPFNRRLDVSPFGSAVGRRDMPLEQVGVGALFNSGMAYAGQGGYIGREGERRGMSGMSDVVDMYHNRREQPGSEFQGRDYRGFYGKR